MTTTVSASCSAPATGGRLALTGRALLRADMLDQRPASPAEHPMAGCPCGSCAAPTWTPEEATDAARHLNNREAVDLALGRARVLSFTDCPDCGAWKATVVPVEPTGDGVVIAMPVIST